MVAIATAAQTAIPILEAAQTAEGPNSCTSIEKRIDAIENALQAIHKDIKAPKTYAAAAAAMTAVPVPRAPQIGKALPLRQEREIAVKATETEGRTYAEIIRKINATAGREVAVAARKLPSGDFAVTCKSTAEKQALEAYLAWTAEAFGENASI